jgi:hypothetical protein
MFRPQGRQCGRRHWQVSGATLTSQRDGRNATSTHGFYVATQVCERAAHAYKIVDEQIGFTLGNWARKRGLSREASEAIGAGMGDHVGLDKPFFVPKAETFRQKARKCLWNRIHAVALHGVRRRKPNRIPRQHAGNLTNPIRVQGRGDEIKRCLDVTPLGWAIARMPMHHSERRQEHNRKA